MVVFIGNLPKYAAEKDICRLARLPLRTAVRIIRKTGRSGQLQRYGLVPVSSESQARRLITRLHGRECLGQKLVAREYQHRIAANERRRVDWRRQDWSGAERRRDERRNRAVTLTSLVA
jgi:hypothetical protein